MSGYSPRGRIVCPSRPVSLGGELVVAGRKPGVIVYIKCGSSRMVREFTRFCSRQGIDALPVQQRVEDERDEAYECVGTVESLERLIGHPSVARWHYILNVPVFTHARGSGPDKVRAPLGSAFGRPEQVKATAQALHDARSARLLDEVKYNRI